MAKIPMRFQRVAAAFDADVARVKPCSESSGSEHSPESSTDLSDLVLSFMEENEGEGEGEDVGIVLPNEEDHQEEVEKPDHKWNGLEKMEKLKGLFVGNEGGDDEDERDAKETIRGEVELAFGFVGNYSTPGFKRRLMSRLREKGFDAGLCKTKWEKNGKLTAGDYEYVDINFSGKRYIVEVSLAAEFEIARPTSQFSTMLDVFPLIFVGKVEDLKRVVRLMCSAIKSSMKRSELHHIPPWRRNAYMQAKWFSSYNRTTNAVATTKKAPLSDDQSLMVPKTLVGFEARSVKAYNCRDVYVGKTTGFRIGHLAAALDADNFG